MTNKKCLTCRISFEAADSEVKRGGGKYCSPTCYYKTRAGQKASAETRRKQSISQRIAKSKTKKPASERFQTFLSKSPDGCWEWTGGLLYNGYGAFSDDRRKSVRAHRFAYELYNGHIPDGLTIDHLCKNRKCVNPAHLEAVTIRENLMRSDSFVAVNAKKTHCVNGHDITSPESYYIAKKTGRQCKQCTKDRDRARKARLRRSSL